MEDLDKKDENNDIIGGTLLFIDNNFLHTQYLHSNLRGKELNALEFLINHIFQNNFEKRFSHFYDYADTAQLQSVKSNAHEEIFERITQDIFNQSLAKW